jgi:hypothetical protein
MLANMWNGTGTTASGGSQSAGGVEDYNAGGSMPNDTYHTTWTSCISADGYCGTGNAAAYKKDEATGVIWSLPCGGSSTTCTPVSPATSGTSYVFSDAIQACLSIDGAHWNLPSQKQMMQAYIDGSYGYLDNTNRKYWSATTSGAASANAWYFNLSGSAGASVAKTTLEYVRCVYMP